MKHALLLCGEPRRHHDKTLDTVHGPLTQSSIWAACCVSAQMIGGSILRPNCSFALLN